MFVVGYIIGCPKVEADCPRVSSEWARAIGCPGVNGMSLTKMIHRPKVIELLAALQRSHLLG